MTETLNYFNIKQEYGVSVLEKIRKFERLSKAKGRYQSHLNFTILNHCDPKGL